MGGVDPGRLEVPAAVIVARFVSLYQQIKQNSPREGKWGKKIINGRLLMFVGDK